MIETIEDYQQTLTKMLQYKHWGTPISGDQYELIKECFSFNGFNAYLPLKEVAKERRRIIDALVERGFDSKRWLGYPAGRVKDE